MKRFLLLALVAAVVSPLGALSIANAADAKPTTNVSKKEAGYVASKEGGKYHKPSCAAVASIKPENKVKFATKAAAEKAGYTACGVCKP